MRPPQPVRVLAHRWMVQELARNLIHNAIKHTPEHGVLQVSIAAQPDGFARLAVLNEGTGISQALQRRLFTPFAAGELRVARGWAWRSATRSCWRSAA